MIIIINKDRTKIQIISKSQILSEEHRETALRITKDWGEPTSVIELLSSGKYFNTVNQHHITKKTLTPKYSWEFDDKNCCK